MGIMSIISMVIGGLFLVGFLIGVLRGWKKATVRFGLLAFSVIAAIVFVPMISESIIASCVDGTTLNIFGLSLDFEEIVSNLAGESEIVSQILEVESTGNVVVAVMNIAVNIVLYFAVFLIVWLLSLLIYGIVILCLAIKNRKNEDKRKKTGPNRIVGGVVGLASMIVVTFALMIPIFGVMNICDAFLTSDTSSSQQGATASSVNNYICGSLYNAEYYTDDETIGGVESYIETYSEIKSAYDSSFIGTFYNVLGLSSLGGISFEYLTTVESNDLEISLSDEIVAVIETYNAYKETFVANKFDLADNNSLDGILKIFDTASSSNIVQSYIFELLPKFSEKWSNGETYLGIACPVDDEYKPLLLAVMDIFSSSASSKDMEAITENLTAVVKTLKVANNHNLITAIQDENTDVIEYISEDESLIKDLVLALASTDKLRNSIPEILDDVIEIAYKMFVGEAGDFSESTMTADEISAIVWKDEATALQGLTTNLLTFYNTLENEDADILNELKTLGEAIDYSRQSAILSEPLQIFITGYLDTLDSSIVSDTIKDQINKYMSEDYWNNTEYSYASLFSAIQKTASAASTVSSVVSSFDSIDLTSDDFVSTITELISDEDVKEVLTEILSDKETITTLITEIAGEDSGLSEYTDEIEVLTDMVSAFVENTTSETIETDIAAAQQIVEIISSSSSSEDGSILGDTDEEKAETASTIITTITSSDAIMSMIDSAVNSSTSGETEGSGETTEDEEGETTTTTSTLENLMLGISDADKSALESAITGDETISDEDQSTLLKLFGITLSSSTEEE